MKRLFMTVFLGVIVAMVFTGWVVSLIVSRDFDARVRSAPPPLGRAAAVLAAELFGQVKPAQRQDLLDRLVADSGLRLRLLSAPEAAGSESCPFHKDNLCWGRRGHRHPPFDMSVTVDLPGGEQALEIREERRFSPWTTSTWLLIVGTMIGVATLAGAVLALPVVRRLRRVQDTAERLERGDLGARAEVTSGDEVGAFAARFNRMAAKLQELVEGRTQMFQAVAHELRTPIARVRFGVEIMADAEERAAREARLEEVARDLDELDHLIEELLLLIRYDAGGSRLVHSRFAAEQAAEAQVGRLRPFHTDRQIDLQSSLPAGTLVLAHRKSFERVLANLLSNAVRHARSRVRVRLYREDAALVADVIDDGPGIPLEERVRVLEPFYRLDRSRSRDSGGVGLGLAIVDRIVKAHGGRIEILDTDGGGALLRTVWPQACSDFPEGTVGGEVEP